MAAPVIRGPHHVAVQVRDLARAEAFYAGLLGLPVVRRWPAEGGGDRSVWVDLGGSSFLALEHAAPDSGLPSEHPFRFGDAGWHLVALHIDAAARQAWERHLAEHAVEVVHRTRWTIYVRDPEGNRLGLTHYPDDAPGA